MFTFNGKQIIIPGAYGIIRVIQLAGATLPDFQVGLVIAKSMKGAPYNSSSKGSEVMLGYSDGNALAKDYGYDDLYNIFAKAKSKGAGAIFVLNAQPNTQAQATLQDNVPADSMDIKATPKNYGVFGNDLKIAVTNAASETLHSKNGSKSGTATGGTSTTMVDSGAGWTISEIIGKWVRITAGAGYGQTREITANTATEITVATWTATDTTSTYEIVEPNHTISVTPTKNEHMLTEDGVDTEYHIYVNSIDGLAAGQTIDLINATDGKEGSHEISTIDTVFDTAKNGFKVVLKTAISGSNCTTALYARIVQEDTEKKASVSFENSEYTLENVVLTMNLTPGMREHIICEVASGATLPPDVLAEGYLGAISGATKGINPTVSENDYTNIARYFPAWVNDFIKVNKVNIRLVCLASTNATTHAAYKSLATEMRGHDYRKPITCIGSPPQSTAINDLITKGQNLNTDEFVLCAQGIDDKPDYLTFLPQVFGIKMYNAVNHNLTRDLIDASKIANEWTLAEQRLLIKNGVLTCISGKTGYKILKGINTYQYHDHEWNEADEMTYLQYFRDIADYVYVGIVEEIDARLIGTDKVTLDKANASVNAICKTFEESDFVDEISPRGLVKVEEGYDVKIDIKIPGITDYFGITVNVLAGYTG